MVRIYKCGVCGRFGYDVVMRKVYKPTVTDCLKTMPLCDKCGKKLYMEKGWLIMKAI